MRTLSLSITAAVALVLAVTSNGYAGGKDEKYTGCLAQGDSAKEFKLTNVNGGTDEYELVGGKGLEGHVGHKVEITGKPVAAKSAAKAEGEKAESDAESTHQHLRVVSMKHVAETCP